MIFPNLWNLFKTFAFSGEREPEKLISKDADILKMVSFCFPQTNLSYG